MHASTVLVAALLSLAVSAAVAYAISQRPVRPGHRGCVAAAWVLLFFFEIIVLSWPKPGGWHSCEYQLFMVVVLSYVCCCWNSSADNTSSEARDVEMDQMDLAPKPDGADAAVDAAAPTSAPGTTRLHYLDNLKAFLTAMVVVSGESSSAPLSSVRPPSNTTLCRPLLSAESTGGVAPAAATTVGVPELLHVCTGSPGFKPAAARSAALRRSA